MEANQKLEKAEENDTKIARDWGTYLQRLVQQNYNKR